MNKLLELMDEKGLNNKEKIKDSIFNTNFDKLVVLVEKMIKAVNTQDEKLDVYTPFSFVASSEMAGTGGCSEILCRLKRAKEFSYYSALYADKVYIDLECINNPHFADNNKIDEFEFKYKLFRDLVVLNELSPLIYDNIVKIIKPEFNICNSCVNELLGPLSTKIDINKMENIYIDKVDISVTFEADLFNYYTYDFNNLNELFEHGSFTYSTKNIDESILKKLIKSPTNKYRFTKEDIKISGILKELFEIESQDLKYHMLESRILNFRYLTSKLFDTHVLALATSPEIENTREIKKRVPVYNLPIISGISIEKILQLRELENDAFMNYRLALNNAAKERIKVGSQKEIDEIYDDIIYPKFIELEKKMNKIKSGTYKKVLGEFIVIGSLISLGVSTGFIPSDPKSIITTLGGVAALTKAGSSIVDWARKNDEIKDNDFYFLWKLKK